MSKSYANVDAEKVCGNTTTEADHENIYTDITAGPKVSSWFSCYDLNWKGVITDESFAHPAKFSHGLIRRIYQHLRDEYGIQPGDTILDPFGGVALGALYAIKAGIDWTGCELEQKFVDLGRANIDKWNQEYGPHFRPWGNARLLQGDSRRLVDVVAQAGGMVGSPPYANVEGFRDKEFSDQWGPKQLRTAVPQGYGTIPGQLGAMPEGGAIISSPPHSSGTVHDGNGIDQDKLTGNPAGRNSQARAEGYGDSDGQLSNLPPGDISAVVSSPPWAGNSGGRGAASRNGIDPALFDRHQGGMVGGIGGDGNLAGMRPGKVGAVIDGLVSSPPFETVEPSRASQEFHQNRASIGINNSLGVGHYGTSPGQLGTDSGDTFWAAAKQILLQCAAILPSGAPAVWVIKSFVRSGQIVDFPGQWQALCEACGFETVEIVRAWLVKDKGTQIGLNGEAVRKTVKRASFFRRLHEMKNPHLSIDYEIVLITRRVLQ